METKRIKEYFDAYDIDGNNILSFDEFMSCLSSLIQESKQRIKEITERHVYVCTHAHTDINVCMNARFVPPSRGKLTLHVVDALALKNSYKVCVCLYMQFVYKYTNWNFYKRIYIYAYIQT